MSSRKLGGRWLVRLLPDLKDAVKVVLILSGGLLELAVQLSWVGSWVRILGLLLIVGGGLYSLFDALESASHRRTAAAEQAAEDSDALRSILYVSPAQASAVDPYLIGVFPSARANAAAQTSRPPYAQREIDQKLDNALRTAGSEGCLLVVKGDPKSGKSRTLYESVAEPRASG